ncbi:MAG: Hint domain-containing protein [Paracoccaceae bacterium]
MPTFTAFGGDILNNANVNSNSSGGQDNAGFIFVGGGSQPFADDAIVVFEVNQFNANGEIDGSSGFIGITVFANAADFAADTALYTYSPQNPGQTANVQSSVDGLGDNYIRFNANVLVSSDSGAPTLSSLFVAPGSGIARLGVDTQFDHHTDIDFDGNGVIDPAPSLDDGNGEFNLGVGITICFAKGTLIETASGEKAVETLSAGDLVRTLDHGVQPIRWIGSVRRPALGKLAPIKICKGALGNRRELMVSPQHRMLLTGWRAELFFGECEVLATAKSLINDRDIFRVEGGFIEYFHILFDTHEIIFSEGTPSESFHPGAMGARALSQDACDEILTLFPHLGTQDFAAYGASARTSLKFKEAALLRPAS